MEKLIHDLSEVVGHVPIIRLLDKMLSSDSVPNVLLLVGNTGLGKTSVAKVLACEVAYATEGRDAINDAKKVVIDESRDTPEVKLFNVSTLRNDSEVQSVKENLNLGFSTTGRKVIIVDEAHGMDERQQDSLLVSLETLPLGVYVFIVTTDASGFRDALIGRCKWKIDFMPLSENDIKRLIREFIEKNELKFEMPVPVLVSNIANYTGNEPRSALNLLGNFECGSLVPTRDLEAFLNVDECEQIIQLVKHLYGPVVTGIEYVSALKVDNTFVRSLLEVTRCALGGVSPRVGRDSLLFIRQLVEDYGTANLMGFAAEISSTGKFNKTILTGLFLKWNYESRAMITGGSWKPEKYNPDKVVREDLNRMQDTIERSSVQGQYNTGVSPLATLEALLEGSEEME